MNDGFTKLFSSIVTSSIWAEDDKTRIVWITMLALADADGYVAASVVGLANLARVTVADTEAAIKRLSEPDQYSRTKDNEGRRIVDAPGGYFILNYSMYRQRARVENRREYLKEYMRNRRKQQMLTDVNNGLTTVNPSASASSSSSDPEGGCKGEKSLILADIPLELRAINGFEELFNDYLENRVAKKAKATKKAQRLILDRLAEKPSMAKDGLKEAIVRNWTGFKWEWMESKSNQPKRRGSVLPGSLDE